MKRTGRKDEIASEWRGLVSSLAVCVATSPQSPNSTDAFGPLRTCANRVASFFYLLLKMSAQPNPPVVAVIGSGFGGMACGTNLLHGLGLTNFIIIEKSSGIGGTWKHQRVRIVLFSSLVLSGGVGARNALTLACRPRPHLFLHLLQLPVLLLYLACLRFVILVDLSPTNLYFSCLHSVLPSLQYPGAAVDVAAHYYSLSFELNPNWSTEYSPRKEILAYQKHVYEKYKLAEYTRFNTEIVSATWSKSCCEVKPATYLFICGSLSFHFLCDHQTKRNSSGTSTSRSSLLRPPRKKNIAMRTSVSGSPSGNASRSRRKSSRST